MSLLEVQDIVTEFKTDHGVLQAVRGVSFTIDQGETVGVVGESGCGKSVTARSVMRLIPEPPGKISQGKILFKGEDVLQMSERQMQKVRGNEISMIFQDPMTSLNPVFTIHYQLDEILRLHQPQLSKQQRYDRCLEMLKRKGGSCLLSGYRSWSHRSVRGSSGKKGRPSYCRSRRCCRCRGRRRHRRLQCRKLRPAQTTSTEGGESVQSRISGAEGAKPAGYAAARGAARDGANGRAPAFALATSASSSTNSSSSSRALSLSKPAGP